MTMLHILTDIRDNILPDLLRDGGAWNSLDITYEKPFVHRLWRQYGDNRILLHEIQPCSQEEAFVHPHQSASAVHVDVRPGVSYEMGVGYGPGPKPPMATTMIVKGPASFAYEMLEPFAWHYVRPIDGPTLSLMITAKPWGMAIPTRKIPLMGPLSSEVKISLLDKFRFLYRKQ